MGAPRDRVVDDERVLVLSHFSARAKASGMEAGERERAFAEIGLVPEARSPGS
jgi:hypothetical protein